MAFRKVTTLRRVGTVIRGSAEAVRVASLLAIVTSRGENLVT